MNDTAARVAGSIFGLIVGSATILGLFLVGLPNKEATQKAQVASDRENRGNPPKATSPPAVQDAAVVEMSKQFEQLKQLAEQQAREIAALKPAAEANRALAIIRRKRAAVDYSRPELLKLAQLSPQNLSAEIQVAISEVANYTADGIFAPQRHFELYRRVNTLYDVPNLRPQENAWLDRGVKELDEMAVRHAERSLKNGELDEVIRTAIALDEWSFRLSDSQEKRFISALNAIAAGTSSK